MTVSHTFYTIQHKRTHEGEWLKLDSPLKPVESRWCLSNWDHFVFEPWSGSGNEYKPVNKTSYNETREVWEKTGYRGWYTLKYAVVGMKNVVKDDDNGKYDIFDLYYKRCQVIRHDFRIVKMTVYEKEIEVVDIKEIIKYI